MVPSSIKVNAPVVTSESLSKSDALVHVSVWQIYIPFSEPVDWFFTKTLSSAIIDTTSIVWDPDKVIFVVVATLQEFLTSKSLLPPLVNVYSTMDSPRTSNISPLTKLELNVWTSFSVFSWEALNNNPLALLDDIYIYSILLSTSFKNEALSFACESLLCIFKS